MMKIPHWNWNCRRLIEDSPIPPDRSTKIKRGEFSVSGFLIKSDSSADCVRLALDDLSSTLESFVSGRSGVELPLTVNIRNKSGRNRDYTAEISRNGIIIQAETAFGAARALYRLRNRLCLRRGPFLKPEVFDSSGSMDPALTFPALKNVSTFSVDYPQAYPDGYLRKIARAGYTGFHINLHYSLFCRSRILPEFRNPDAEKNLAELKKTVEAAARFGLDVFLSYYRSPIKGDHPVLKRLPEIRGSRMVGSADSYVLCTSHPLVRSFFAEQMTDLFSAVPELGGILAISGCEGWLHCHTACAQTEDGLCECPRCRKLEPETSVAEMFNCMAAAVKTAAPEARFVVWNYGIFAWSDIGAEKFISRLSKDCLVMANFDTGDAFRLEGAEGMAFDYSLRCTGPSKPYLKQFKTAGKKKLGFLAKCESGAPLEYCSLPYVPAMTRWMRKYEGIRTTASGALYNWKFLGYNCGLAQELAGLSSSGEDSSILRKLAVREFGEKNAAAAVRAWRCFDRAMDFHPFSGPSAGYFKGPFFIGPAQPLYLKQPTAFPECLLYNGNPNRPVVMTDLTFVEPFGVKSMLRALEKMLSLWRQGIALLEPMEGTDRYQKAALASHLNVCRMFLCFLETARNMTEFYSIRDSIHTEAYTPEKLRTKLSALKKIAERELANAESALQLLQADKLLGFSAIYPPGITEEMVRCKIGHTKSLLETELPFRWYSSLFSFNRHPRWTGKDF